MASGVPLLISDIPSLTEITSEPEVTLFSPDDPKALAHSLSKLYDNYADKKYNAEKLKQKSKQFVWEKRAKKILDYIKY
jgi:glycosyltransferase involved in cell wall biosynthesis